MHKPRLLCFAGSIRSGSVNQALAGAMAKKLSLMEMDVTYLSLADYPLPLFNADDEKEKGLPEEAVALAKIMASHDGIFIASPEYNGSVTPLLKNMLDWVSRVPAEARSPYRTPVFAIGAASPGQMGGLRSLAHLRQILVALGAIIVPEQVGIGGAGSAFDNKGDLIDERQSSFLDRCAQSLAQTAQRLKPLE